MPDPLHVTATLVGAISLPSGRLGLDALLMAAVAIRDGLPPASVTWARELPIPVAKEPCGRFHLASFSESAWEGFETRWVNRRFPLAEAQALAEPKLRRIQITTGPCKSFRLPLEAGHLRDDRIEWWCLGEAEPIRELLALVSHLGKRRGVGNGRVRKWHVEPCEPWGEGFPVVRDRRALRPLPPDWPGLEAPSLAYGRLSPPYWLRTDEELVAMPEGIHA